MKKTIEQHLKEFTNIFKKPLIVALVLFILFFYLSPTIVHFLFSYYGITNVVALSPLENRFTS